MLFLKIARYLSNIIFPPGFASNESKRRGPRNEGRLYSVNGGRLRWPHRHRPPFDRARRRRERPVQLGQHAADVRVRWRTRGGGQSPAGGRR